MKKVIIEIAFLDKKIGDEKYMELAKDYVSQLVTADGLQKEAIHFLERPEITISVKHITSAPGDEQHDI